VEFGERETAEHPIRLSGLPRPVSAFRHPESEGELMEANGLEMHLHDGERSFLLATGPRGG